MEHLRVEIEDRIATVTLDRPPVNALTHQTFRELKETFDADGSLALDRDEHLRPGTTLEALAGLSPSFVKMGGDVFEGFDRSFDDMCRQAYPNVEHVEHVHHGGNSSGVVDGAAAIVLASEDYAKAHGLAPRARIVMHADAHPDRSRRAGTSRREHRPDHHVHRRRHGDRHHHRARVTRSTSSTITPFGSRKNDTQSPPRGVPGSGT